jgi:hypothetical protein
MGLVEHRTRPLGGTHDASFSSVSVQLHSVCVFRSPWGIKPTGRVAAEARRPAAWQPPVHEAVTGRNGTLRGGCIAHSMPQMKHLLTGTRQSVFQRPCFLNVAKRHRALPPQESWLGRCSPCVRRLQFISSQMLTHTAIAAVGLCHFGICQACKAQWPGSLSSRLPQPPNVPRGCR